MVLLHNSAGDEVRTYLESAFPAVIWTFIRADTPSSWASFQLVSMELASNTDRFIVSTVDALISPQDVARFSQSAFEPLSDGVPAGTLGLTAFVDDEKPLWADVDDSGRVVRLGPDATDQKAVTCGLYALRRETVRRMQGTFAHSSLREFWTALVRSGEPVRGVLLGKAVDVDRPEDVLVAERIASCFDA